SVQAATTLRLQGDLDHGNAIVSVADGTSSAGTILLDSIRGDDYAQLVLAGSLTSTGTLEALGASGDRYLSDGTFSSRGFIGIAPGITLSVSNESFTSELGALITGGGILDTSGATFANDGTIDLSMPSVLDETIQPSTLAVTYVSTVGMNTASVTDPANYDL